MSLETRVLIFINLAVTFGEHPTAHEKQFKIHETI